MTILRIALPTPLRRLFDYLPPQGLDNKALIPGIRVLVPFQARTLVGVLVEVAAESVYPKEKLKTALALLDVEPVLPKDVYEMCAWASDYYHYSLGEVISHAMPMKLRKGEAASPLSCQRKLASRKKEAILDASLRFHDKQGMRDDSKLTLNNTQQNAITTILAAKNSFSSFLLDGVTGSGKTEVYLQLIKEMIADEKQVLVLVPEISLTPQTIARFRARFSVTTVALHSGLSEKERLQSWLRAKSGEAKIIIGTRSAIFIPCVKLGLIIVDEEHDTSFKQQDRFRYHARDLAILRARMNDIPVILGSATPSLESLWNVARKRYEYLCLPERAGDAELPVIQLIDLRKERAQQGLTPSLLQAMQAHLAAGNQVLLFLNRRGFAPVLYCTECAWIAGCARCDARMVYHRKPKQLQCHHCDARTTIPSACASCGALALQPVGLGTERLEEILATHFPDVPIIRVDRDTTKKKGALHALLDEINAQPKAILLGTQMLAKGHHFPNVTLVGMIDADSGLLSADFRAAEQMGQLLTQVAGRAGRAEKPGTVCIQTAHPHHPLLQMLIHQGYQPFSNALLAERKQAQFPPYIHLAVFRAESYLEKTAATFLTDIKLMCLAETAKVNVLGPVPALIAKRKGLHCQHLIVKADKRSVLQQTLKKLLQQIETLALKQRVKWVLDVDPIEV